jgi:tetratricopeptide (TPR) repeat protein
MRSSFIIVFILLPFFCTSQQKEIDSFLTVLKNHPAEDTVRLHLLSDISYDYYQINPDKGIAFASEIITLAKKIKDTSWLGIGYARMGLNYNEKGEPGIALDYYKQATAIFETLNDEIKLFGVRNNTAILYMQVADFSSALNLYFKNLRYCELKKKDIGLAVSAGNIARTYEKMGNYQQALIYNQKAIDVQRRLKNADDIANLLNSRGNIFDSKEEPENALPFYRESLALSESTGNEIGINSAKANLGNIFEEMGIYDSALHYLNNTLTYYKQSGAKRNTAVVLHYLGNIISKAGNDVLLKEGVPPAKRYDVANSYYQQSIAIYKGAGDISGEAENWQSISSNYKMMGQFNKALEAYEHYSTLKDSVLSDEKLDAVKELEKQHVVKKNQDSLTLIQEAKDITANAEISRQRTLQRSVTLGGAALLLAAFISFIFYKKRRDAKQKQAEAEFNTEVSETEMKALRSQMNPHFIFNSLNSIGDYIAKNNVQEADRYLSKFAKLMRMILENSEQKDVSIADDLKALELYMQLEALRMNNKFTYEIKVDDDIDKETTLIPPLILQPFVENSIWHGIAQKEGTGKIWIHIKKENDDMINCIVEDDGIGRKQSAAIKTTTPKQEKTSLGMKITQSRIDILNKIKNTKAVVQLSDLAQGVRVEVKLPLATNY